MGKQKKVPEAAEEERRDLTHLSDELNTRGGAITFNLLFATPNKDTPRAYHRVLVPCRRPSQPTRTTLIKIKGLAGFGVDRLVLCEQQEERRVAFNCTIMQINP